MKKRWKRLAALMGGAVLVLGQNGMIPVQAEEVSAAEASQQQDGIEAQAETAGYQASPATNLHWDEYGHGYFTNPNGMAYIYIYVYGPGCAENGSPYMIGSCGYGKDISVDLYHYIHEVGTYTFKVAMMSDSHPTVWSEESPGFAYTEKPEFYFPVPTVSVTKEGVVSCTLPEDIEENYTLGEDYGLDYMLFSRVGEGQYKMISQRGGDMTTWDFGPNMAGGEEYFVRVKIRSRDIRNYLDGEWTDFIPVDPDAQVQKKAQAPAVHWEPTTPDEIKRFSLVGSEAIDYTVDAKTAYSVTVENSVQGEKCFVSFEAAAGDYLIGRTYNIFPNDTLSYKMDSKARITLTIPKDLQADNREFKMISVTENGLPAVLNDLDTDPTTITFETDTYYAFALIYKDAVK